MWIVQSVMLVISIVIIFVYHAELKEKQKTIDEFRTMLRDRFTRSFNDPQLRSMRVLLPKELEDVKNVAMNEYNTNPDGLHSECHKTLLIVLNTLSSDSVK